MAIGPIGNAIYVNQQTASVASLKTEFNNRIDFQNMAAQAIANEKEKEIEDVRPTEENHAVDPDREHQRQELDEELSQQGKKKKKKKEDEEPKEEKSSIYKLDIKV
jgi:hypothetical protein